MANIYHEADCIAKSGERLLFGVSLGRDSACFLRVLSTRVKLQDHAFFHYSCYWTLLPYQQRQLEAIEARYGIKIEVRPDPRSSILKGLRTFAEDRDIQLDAKGCGLMVLGYRMDESLQRRGMLKQYTDGINPKTRECYPLRSWTSRITDAYVKANRITLAPEYALGLSDLTEHRQGRAVVLRHYISEADYQAAIAQDPQVEIDYVRYAHKHREELFSEIQGNGDQP